MSRPARTASTAAASRPRGADPRNPPAEASDLPGRPLLKVSPLFVVPKNAGRRPAGKHDHWSPVRLRTVIPARKTYTPLILAVAALIGVSAAIGSASAAAAATTAATAQIQPAVLDDALQRPVDQDASFYVNIARGISQQASGKVSTISLDVQIAQLDQSEALPELTVGAFTQQLRGTIGAVSQQLDTYNARQAELAEQRAAAAAQAAALAQSNTPDGARATARALMLSRYGWGAGQFACLDSLWNKESGWNYQAYNAGGGATGIPQALPGSKMASAGADWRTNAATQVAWGLDYISRAYGSPCAAWGHSQAMNWY